MRCAVYGCRIDNQTKKFLLFRHRFHTFPRDEIVREKWISACGRPAKFNDQTSRICSKHFSETDYVRNLQHEFLNYVPSQGPKLKADAVPHLDLPKIQASLQENIKTEDLSEDESIELGEIILQERFVINSFCQLTLKVISKIILILITMNIFLFLPCDENVIAFYFKSNIYF